MRTLKSKIVKATALGLTLTVTHVCLSTEMVRAASARLIAKATASRVGAQGRLTTRGNNPVALNGNSARSGETVFSGQSLRTPAGVGATVNIPGLGRGDIAPDSAVTLSFEAGRVTAALASGCVVLTADRGVVGSVVTGGTALRTDADRGGSLDVCASSKAGAEPVVGEGAARAGAAAGQQSDDDDDDDDRGGLFGIGRTGTLVLIAATGAVITTAAVLATPCRRSTNPSPSNPLGGNDECL